MFHRLSYWLTNLLASLLPRFLRVRFYWNKVGSADQIFHNSPYTFKMATTDEEIRQSYYLLYSQYKNNEIPEDSRQFLRISKHYAFPTSCLFIAKHESTVIATLVLIPDSEMGLPMDAGWDLSNLRNSHGKIAEISGLSVKPGFRHKTGALLFPLFSALLYHCQKNLSIKALVIKTPTLIKHYYSCLLGFQPVNDPKQTLPYSDSVKAYGQFLSITPSGLDKQMTDRPRLRNDRAGLIYRSLFNGPESFNNIIVPPTEEDYKQHLSMKLFNNLFNKNVEVFFQFSPEDRKLLLALHSNQQDIIYPEKESCFAEQQAHKRFAVFIPAKINHVNEATNICSIQIPSSVYDISKEGLCICCPRASWRSGDHLKIILEHPSFSELSLNGTVVWQDKDHIGIHLEQPPSEWLSWVEDCENRWRQKELLAS